MSALRKASPAAAGPAFDGDRSPREHLTERQRRDAAGGGDAWQTGEPLPSWR